MIDFFIYMLDIPVLLGQNAREGGGDHKISDLHSNPWLDKFPGAVGTRISVENMIIILITGKKGKIVQETTIIIEVVVRKYELGQ